LLGGAAKNVFKRVVDHANGWLPNRITPPDLERARREIDRLAAEVGRDPKSITITVYGQEPNKDVVRPLFDAGADRVVVRSTHAETEAEMGSQLQRIAEAVL
jgi:alkanesulfonate monooxygenase SsuD/methylene tetrahydromethanopterin reductase-like flavin-dependent oxidoreductase (luciferase family)